MKSTLRLSPLPIHRPTEESDLRLMEREGFVDEEVVAALRATQPVRRTTYPEDLALSADDLDFAGWCVPTSTPASRPTAAPAEAPIATRRAAPPVAQPTYQSAAPARGASRWWFAGLAGVFTSLLLLAVPDLDAKRPMVGIPGQAPSPMARPTGCAFAPRCPIADAACWVAPPGATEVGARHTVRCYKAQTPLPAVFAQPLPAHSVRATDERPVVQLADLRAGYGSNTVLEDIDLSIYAGDCVALLGESGSGKTTLSRCVAGLHPSFTGGLFLNGEPLAASSFRRTKEQRRKIQYIFQNPYESLNPRRTVGELILQPLVAVGGRVRNGDDIVTQALERASLRPDHARRYPDQLSGGERQRVAIARALVTNPDVLVCDEITSALDVSVQSSLVDLLRELQAEIGLTLLFITHNIALVRNIAQQVAVLQHGRIVEFGDVADVFDNPQHEYTRSLMTATPNFQLPNRLGGTPGADCTGGQSTPGLTQAGGE